MRGRGGIFVKNNPMQGRIVCLPGVAIAVLMAAAPLAGHAAPAPTDAEAVALAARHCTPCHSEMPTHAVFDKAPKGIKLETVEELRRYAKGIVEQAVVGRMMPLGNETDMTDEERDRLGAWAEGRK
jgi:uncharacterized membrane protein